MSEKAAHDDLIARIGALAEDLGTLPPCLKVEGDCQPIEPSPVCAPCGGSSRSRFGPRQEAAGETAQMTALRRELGAQRRQYRELLAAVRDACLLTDPSGGILEANQAASSLLMQSVGELLTTNIEKLVAEEDRQEIAEAMRRLRRGRKSRSGEFCLTCGGARVISAEFTAFPVRDRTGKLTAVRWMLRDMSRWRLATSCLRETRQLSQMLLEVLPHPAVLVGRGRKIIAANRIASQMGAATGRPCRECLGEDLGPASGGTVRGPCPQCGLDEALQTARPSRRPLMWAQGRVRDTYWVPLDEDTCLKYSIDVTDRIDAEAELLAARDCLEHRVAERTEELALTVSELEVEARERMDAEAALSRANELLEQIFSGMPLRVAYLDRQFNCIRVNRAFADAAGRTGDCCTGLNYFQLYPDAEAEELFRQAVETGKPVFAYETPVQDSGAGPDGGRFCDWSLQPVHGEDGLVVALVLCQTDVTDRVAAREQAEMQRRRLFSVLDMLPGFVILVDRQYTIRYANDTFRSLFGDPAQRTCHEAIRSAALPCRTCPPRRVFETGQPETYEWTCRQGRCYRVYAYPFSDIDGQRLVLQLGIDITESKQLEKQVLQVGVMERRRIGQDLHDSLGQTLTGVAFRNKVLQERLARQSLPEAAIAAEIAQQIKESIALTRSLARGLHPVRGEDRGLMDALLEFAHDASHRFDIRCDFHCEKVVLFPDSAVATHLYHIAQEAVNNAVRHGKCKGVDIILADHGEQIVLSICDDGCGLSANSFAKDGMGLRIMRYRAGVIGGSLEIAPGPTGGTIVTCCLRPLIARP